MPGAGVGPGLPLGWRQTPRRAGAAGEWGWAVGWALQLLRGPLPLGPRRRGRRTGPARRGALTCSSDFIEIESKPSKPCRPEQEQRFQAKQNTTWERDSQAKRSQQSLASPIREQPRWLEPCMPRLGPAGPQHAAQQAAVQHSGSACSVQLCSRAAQRQRKRAAGLAHLLLRQLVVLLAAQQLGLDLQGKTNQHCSGSTHIHALEGSPAGPTPPHLRPCPCRSQCNSSSAAQAGRWWRGRGHPQRS